MLSPGIETKEINLQTTIARSSTGRVASVGKFNWGPAFQVSQIISEPDLVDKFGAPDDLTADSFMTVANFLTYGNDVRLVRVIDESTALNSSAIAGTLKIDIATPGISYAVGDIVKITHVDPSFIVTGTVTKVGPAGEILSVFVESGKLIEFAKSIGDYPALKSVGWTIVVESITGTTGGLELNGVNVGSGIMFPNDEFAAIELASRGQAGKQSFLDKCEYYGIPAVASRFPSERGDFTSVVFVAYEDYYKFNETTKVIIGNNTMNPTVFPSGEKFGNITPASFLEFGPQNSKQFAMLVFKSGSLVESRVLSLKPGDKDVYGASIHIDEFFANGKSSFVQGIAQSWPVGFTGALQFGGGNSGLTTSAGDWIQGWDYFSDREYADVNLFNAGACAGEGVAIASAVQKAVVAIGDTRSDCLISISPPRELVVNLPVSTAVKNVVEWRRGVSSTGAALDDNMNISSTYAEIDGNYKYQYDKYNDKNRWIPLSGDICGLCARTDTVGQPWQSPAGFTRGQINNVIKLAIETRQGHRDELYQNGINPVVGFASQGFVLYGDKTASQAPTPFDRINVRRLFNLLKKSISESAKYKLFELNDKFTRSSFRTEVNSYLDTIRSLGGIYDFRVICDESNNTQGVIDRNEFVATIMVKPARSINFITLSFVATDTGADFDEVVGSANLG
ncbi:MAG: phage tail sheath subtilisin-like domain-containing protein [Culicoidibacterales bacterium]